MSDQDCMRRALKLAAKARGKTWPNPMVGAVIVKNDKVIAEGFHHAAGRDHAEVDALHKLRSGEAEGATLYVTLEPCSHYGKTPPCAQAIVKAGISKVVCSITDPNPIVNGKGFEYLKNNGIEVSVGLMRDDALRINKEYVTFHTKKRPYVTLKFATTLDGKLATKTNDSKWITNERARSVARKLRSEHQAILVGTNTVVMDNPNLGSQSNTKDPLRIIIDSTLKLTPDIKVFRDDNYILVTTDSAPRERVEQYESQGISLIMQSGERIDIEELLKTLYERSIVSLFLEGGGNLIGSFLDARMVDEVYTFMAPVIVGGSSAVTIGGRGIATITESLRLKDVSIKKIADNFMIHGYV
jgi:diaminohydroxyphosphoribosylaminopyrimidine deaminase/5-amino-6-(5-phosphoribosylamino)uracil reductase